MDAKSFWEAFCGKLKSKEEEAKNAWPFNKDYTEFIVGMMGEILEEAKLAASKEYYRIDLTGWTQRRDEIGEKVPESENYKFQPYLWDLEIAIEHENNDKLWMDEVIKLAHICCGLRVVIGYVPRDLDQRTYLNFVARAVKGKLKAKENMGKGEFLVLLGKTKLKEGDKKCDYTPYRWNEKGFELQKEWLDAKEK